MVIYDSSTSIPFQAGREGRGMVKRKEANSVKK
jgi:hypothetical protein